MASSKQQAASSKQQVAKSKQQAASKQHAAISLSRFAQVGWLIVGVATVARWASGLVVIASVWGRRAGGDAPSADPSADPGAEPSVEPSAEPHFPAVK